MLRLQQMFVFFFFLQTKTMPGKILHENQTALCHAATLARKTLQDSKWILRVCEQLYVQREILISPEIIFFSPEKDFFHPLPSSHVHIVGWQCLQPRMFCWPLSGLSYHTSQAPGLLPSPCKDTGVTDTHHCSGLYFCFILFYFFFLYDSLFSFEGAAVGPINAIPNFLPDILCFMPPAFSTLI